MSTGMLIGCWIVIFLLLVVGFFFLLKGAYSMDMAHINMNHIMEDLRGKKETTVKKAEAKRRKYGSSTSDGEEPGIISKILIKIDNQLVWSGTSLLRPWFTAPIYIIVTIVCGVTMFGLGYVTFNAIIGFLFACVVTIFPYAYVIHLTNVNYHNTEIQLKFFINLIASNSSGAGDLVNVLEHSIEYVADPIRGALQRAVSSARISGNPDEAIWQLEREMEHPLFKSFIRNLDICSKNDADFRAVASDFSAQADQSIAALERQRAIFANARNEVLLMIVVGVGLSFATAYFCEKSLFEVVNEMTHSLLGMVCIFLECVIYVAAIAYMLLGKKR